jgi:F-type H+-transporting ATPase subunit delta
MAARGRSADESTPMNGGRVARRYARAAFDIAAAAGQVEEWLRDLRVVESVLRREDVLALLENPAVPFADKRRVVESTLVGLDPLRLSFVYVLVEHGRASHISEVVAEYQAALHAYQGIAVAEVTTAIPLDEAESRAVAEHLERLVGKRIVLEKTVDPTILGGIVARIGDRLLDGSIAGQLRSLRRDLTAL